jgi:YD repeat-containing protein
MFHSTLYSLLILGSCAGFMVADEAKSVVSKDKIGKDAKEAKITKIDAKKGTVTVKMQSKGKEVEKTFKLAEDIEYMDSTGKVAAVDLFTSGDLVLIVEREGTITKMKRDANEAKITKVDAKTGTVTVKMQCEGKEVEKTFKLAEDIEYMDSTGKVAAVDLFTSGDLVLIVEREGTITKMKKKDVSDSAKKPVSK